jgi:hypothetical protein
VIPVIVVGLVGLGVGLFLGCVYGLGLSIRVLRAVRDSLPLLKPTDGNVAAVRRVIAAGVSARPALGEAITRLESGGGR